MARIRTIKPSFWGSPTIAPLSRDARLLAIGPMSYADDDGRFLPATNAINGYVFPNDNLAPAKVRRWLDECQATGFVHLYTADGILYGCIPTWHLHQVINRYTTSLLPEPDIECAPRSAGGKAA